MGMCIVYRAVPPSVESHAVAPGAFPEKGFGRRVPVALGLLLAAEEEREPLRRAARELDWSRYLPPRADPRTAAHAALDRMVQGLPPNDEQLPLAAVWGGPPARAEANGRTRLLAAAVEAIARELQGRDEASLGAAYEREREHVGDVLDEATTIRCYVELQELFASAAASGSDLVISWEYG